MNYQYNRNYDTFCFQNCINYILIENGVRYNEFYINKSMSLIIEKNSDFNPILPYHKFRRPKTSKRILYKLHGDAEYESKYIDKIQDNIVFSQSQYLQAITSEDNTYIYKALLADYAQEH